MSYNITIACKKENLKTLREFVSESLQNHGLSDVDINAMVLAIDEISANLIIHAHNNNPKDSFDLKIEILNDGIEFKIFDDADVFDITKYEAPELSEIIRTKRKGGVGLILVKKIMDEITFEKKSGKNCCRLYKKTEVH